MAHTATTAALLPRDYLLAADTLYFAVVLAAAGGAPVHCSLRYRRLPGQPPQKLASGEAHALLADHYPQFLRYSEQLGSEAVLLPAPAIQHVYRPGEALRRLLEKRDCDALEQTALHAVQRLTAGGVASAALGITGSLLPGFHNPQSDIDLVVYGTGQFHRARDAVREALASGLLQGLDEQAWRDAHARRDCALDFAAYHWHEQRKYNKFMLDGVKIDLGCVSPDRHDDVRPPVAKLGRVTLRAGVTDDSRAYDYPAVYGIDSDVADRILCYTATYTGQACTGEGIEAAGMLERDARGRRYLVVGTSREAPEEYIKVTG